MGCNKSKHAAVASGNTMKRRPVNWISKKNDGIRKFIVPAAMEEIRNSGCEGGNVGSGGSGAKKYGGVENVEQKISVEVKKIDNVGVQKEVEVKKIEIVNVQKEAEVGVSCVPPPTAALAAEVGSREDALIKKVGEEEGDENVDGKGASTVEKVTVVVEEEADAAEAKVAEIDDLDGAEAVVVEALNSEENGGENCDVVAAENGGVDKGGDLPAEEVGQEAAEKVVDEEKEIKSSQETGEEVANMEENDEEGEVVFMGANTADHGQSIGGGEAAKEVVMDVETVEIDQSLCGGGGGGGEEEDEHVVLESETSVSIGGGAVAEEPEVAAAGAEKDVDAAKLEANE